MNPLIASNLSTRSSDALMSELVLPPKKRITAKRSAETEAPIVQLPLQQCVPLEFVDSDDEAAAAHQGGTFWRGQKQAKPEASCRLGVAERRQPRIGDQYQVG